MGVLWIPSVPFATCRSHFMHRDRTNAMPDHFKWPRLNWLVSEQPCNLIRGHFYLITKWPDQQRSTDGERAAPNLTAKRPDQSFIIIKFKPDLKPFWFISLLANNFGGCRGFDALSFICTSFGERLAKGSCVLVLALSWNLTHYLTSEQGKDPHFVSLLSEATRGEQENWKRDTPTPFLTPCWSIFLLILKISSLFQHPGALFLSSRLFSVLTWCRTWKSWCSLSYW